MNPKFGILLIMIGALLAQAPDKRVRPKIGLVVSGGGALGLYHVGVLQWLEKNTASR
jgi:NTE family protein